MNGRIRNIVIGVAEVSDEENPYLNAAIELVEELDATLHVVHGFYLTDPARYPQYRNIYTVEHIQETRQAVQRLLEESVRRVSASDRIKCRAVPFSPETALLDTVEEVHADLLIVGATRRGRIGRALLGTTAQRVMRNSPVPVLVRRSLDSGPLRRILFATDLSELSEKAYERGRELVAQLAPEEPALRSILVVRDEMPIPSHARQSALIQAAEERLEDFIERTRADGSPMEGRVVAGEPAEKIAAEASEWGADLLVLGTHGRTGTSRFLIGSVAESVTQRAPCNVLVIPNAATV